MITELFWPY